MFLIRFLLADLLLHFLFITGLRGARGAVEVDIVLFGIHGSPQRQAGDTRELLGGEGV